MRTQGWLPVIVWLRTKTSSFERLFYCRQSTFGESLGKDEDSEFMKNREATHLEGHLRQKVDADANDSSELVPLLHRTVLPVDAVGASQKNGVELKRERIS